MEAALLSGAALPGPPGRPPAWQCRRAFELARGIFRTVCGPARTPPARPGR